MYQFSSKLKTFSFALMILGAIGIVWGFMNVPSTVEQANEIIAAQAVTHNSEHGENTHQVATHNDAHATEGHSAAAQHDAGHAEHVFHQLQNRPWAAMYVAIFFFLMLALGTLAFYAIQHAAQVGWSIVLLRVMEGITAYLPVGAVILFVFLMSSTLHLNHIFPWMNPELSDASSPKYDEILALKSGFLNIPFFIIRAIIYIGGWIFYRQYSRKQTLALDNAKDGDLTNYRKLFKASILFLAFFLVTETLMSWDWLMSIDFHWYSTLYGWYVFAGMIVTAITTIAMVTIYLKSQGYLEFVNDSHLHDLAKFMFGFSIFWTYLWFSQFMLIWYANIPEEVPYFIQRFDELKIPFLGMVVLNFVFPILILMNSDYKRLPWFIIIAGVFVFVGHYIDVYILITPGTVGAQWKFLSPEVIGSLLFFLGLFIFVVFNAIAKAPLKVKGNPFLKESEHFHY